MQPKKHINGYNTFVKL